MARPPVCKLMDYGKFKYESALKARESRKNQAQTIIKEIKLRPKIDPHDYGTKKGHVERFLKQGDKVKVTIMFRGREQSRPELGFKLLQRLAADVEELGFVESTPKQDGLLLNFHVGFLNGIPVLWTVFSFILLIGGIYYSVTGRYKKFAAVKVPGDEPVPAGGAA